MEQAVLKGVVPALSYLLERKRRGPLPSLKKSEVWGPVSWVPVLGLIENGDLSRFPTSGPFMGTTGST